MNVIAPDGDDWGEWTGLDSESRLLLLRREIRETRSDLANLKVEMRAEFAGLRAEMVSVRSRVVGAIVAVQLIVISALLYAVLAVR